MFLRTVCISTMQSFLCVDNGKPVKHPLRIPVMTNTTRYLLSTLAFYAKHGALHSFDSLPVTVKAVKTLESEGYLIVDWNTKQAQYTGKVWSM